MNGPFILFLCGGRWQVPWISFLKSKGHKIILVDPNENSWCAPYADIFFRSDVKDINAIRKFVDDNHYEIELVTSEQTDVSTIPVAKLSEHYKTPHIPFTVVEKFTDKFKSKIHASKISEQHIPKFSKVSTTEDLVEFSNHLNKAVIVKPSDSQSSRGISILGVNPDWNDANDAFNFALKFGTNPYIIAEELVSGIEITIEGIVRNGKHTILASSRKKHFRTGIASELAYPLILKPGFEAKIHAFHNNVVESTGINFGITHSEYFINEVIGDFWLVEMACRGGGSLIPSSIIPWVSGIDVYEIHYNQLFKKPDAVSVPVPIQPPKTAILHFLEFPSGKVDSIEGLEQSRSIKGVHIIDLEFKAGDHIFPASDDRGRQGFVIVLTETENEARDIIKRIYSSINIALT